MDRSFLNVIAKLLTHRRHSYKLHFVQPKQPFTRGRNRKPEDVNAIVIHESVSFTAAGTISVLRRRKLGVHYMVSPYGEIFMFNDQATRTLYHIPEHNDHSIGIEVVNPFWSGVKPSALAKYGWGTDPLTVKATWLPESTVPNRNYESPKARYIAPTLAQLEALWFLLHFIVADRRIEIPFTFVNETSDGTFVPAPLEDSLVDKPLPGIWAHYSYGNHADGMFPTMVMWVCARTGMSVEQARDYVANIFNNSAKRVAEISLPGSEKRSS